MNIEKVAQWIIAIFGSVGFFLIATKNPWGFVITLATEPFWFVATWKRRQWGMFFLTILYTFSCLYGIDSWFFSGHYLHLLTANL